MSDKNLDSKRLDRTLENYLFTKTGCPRSQQSDLSAIAEEMKAF